jgi:hypothetical protein
MSGLIQVPSGIPSGVAQLIQTNMLSRDLKDGLRPTSMYRRDFGRELLPAHIGETLTKSRLSMFEVDLKPAAPLGEIEYAQFSAEQFTAKPIPYAKGFRIDGPTSYVQVGNWMEQQLKRLAEWGGRTSSRLARGRLFAYNGGKSIVRLAATTSDSSLYVSSLMGFRTNPISGTLQPVSAANPLAITIVAATTFTALVTGVTPDDANFPDGPGTLVLSTTLSANVAGKSYVVATNTKPFSLIAADRASTEALLTTDWPTLANVLKMRARLMDTGIPKHRSSNTYHLHCDSTFLEKIAQDAKWAQAFQGAGISPIFGAGALFVPNLGITIFENNDSPSYGKGKEVHVGSLGTDNSVTMKDIGLDVLNSGGVYIRRAILTGDDVGYETFIDESVYYSEMGIKTIGAITSNLNVYQFNGGAQFVSGEVDGWRLTVTPALDPRQLMSTVAISMVADWTLGTDYFNAAAASNAIPLKRAVVLEYGSDW